MEECGLVCVVKWVKYTKEKKMVSARYQITIREPVQMRRGLMMNLSSRDDENEETGYCWGISVGEQTFIWIESGWVRDENCAVERVTLFIESENLQAIIINLVLGIDRSLSRLLWIAESTLESRRRDSTMNEFERVIGTVRVRKASEFLPLAAYLRGILPMFIVDATFGGRTRVERAAEAAMAIPKREYHASTPLLVYYIYLEIGHLIEERDRQIILSRVELYARQYDSADRHVYWEELKQRILDQIGRGA